MPVITDEVRKNLPEEARKYLEELEGKVNKDAPEPEINPLYKGMSPEQVAHFSAQDERLNKIELEREEGEEIAKAKALKVSKPEEFGKAMLRVRKGRPNEGDVALIEGEMVALRAQADTGALFMELGGNGEGAPGSAIEEATTKARKLMADNPGTYKSEAAARSAVWDQEPELAKRYEQESRG